MNMLIGRKKVSSASSEIASMKMCPSPPNEKSESDWLSDERKTKGTDQKLLGLCLSSNKLQFFNGFLFLFFFSFVSKLEQPPKGFF